MNTFLSKKDLPKEINLNQLVEYMTGPSKRPKWDTGFNEYKLIEGSDSCGILYSWMKSLNVAKTSFLPLIFKYKPTRII